jgi:acid stress chaperone HdeA
MNRDLAAAALAIAFIAMPSPAPADASRARTPLVQLTCAEFLSADDAVKPEIVYWAATHGRRGHPESEPVDVGDTDRIVPVLVEQCKATPAESLWPKVRAETVRFAKRP